MTHAGRDCSALNLDPTAPPLTVTDTAKALNVSTDAIYDAIARGEIRARRLGRLIRVPRAEIARLLMVSAAEDQSAAADDDTASGGPRIDSTTAARA